MKPFKISELLCTNTKENSLSIRIYELLYELKSKGYMSISMRELRHILGISCGDEIRILIVELKHYHYLQEISLPVFIWEEGIRGYGRKRNFIIHLNRTKISPQNAF